MIKAILFDADGVVINTTERFSSYLEREYGITTKTTAPFFQGVFQDCIVGKADLKEEVSKYLPKWGWKKSVDEFLQYWFESEHKIHEPMVKEIHKIRKQGIKCYLATNQEKYRTTYILENMGFESLFDGTFSSAEVGHKKDRDEYYQHILSQLAGVTPEEILLWDDSMENIDKAKQLKINAEFYTSFEDFQEKMESYLKNKQI